MELRPHARASRAGGAPLKNAEFLVHLTFKRKQMTSFTLVYLSNILLVVLLYILLFKFLFFTFTCDLLTYGYPTVVPRTSLLPSVGARKKRDARNVFDLG